VLNALTGAEKYFLDLSGLVDGTLPLNQVGVGDDGAVYAANLTTTATSPPYKIYRWASDALGVPLSAVFIGDPGSGVQSNLRWGDSFAVRGAGTNTQILIAPGNTSTNVVLLRTGGTDFQTEIPPAVIAIGGVPAGFGAITLGVAFGPGTNTFWAKASLGQLYLIQFDLTSKTNAVIQSYSTSLVSASVKNIAANQNQRFLAGVGVEAPNDNVRLYGISDLIAGPLLRDQEAFATQIANANGTAASAFGANHLFALDSNNGIKAFAINTNYVPPQPVFSITNFTVSASGQVLTWPATFGVTYQVQYKDALSDPNWTDIGGRVTATSSPLSFTNNGAGSSRFFRVRGQ